MLLAVLETKYLVLSKLTDTVLSFSHRTENNLFTGLGKVNNVYNKQQWA